MPAARILCIAPNWLGDAILARPALALLGRAGVTVELESHAGRARALADIPGIGTVHARDGAGRGARLRAGWRLRARRFDAVLVMPPSWSAALAGRLTGARVRVGLDTDHRRGLLTHPVADPGRRVHLATTFVQLARTLLDALGMAAPRESLPGPLPMPPLAPRAHEIEAAGRLLRAHGIDAGPTLVVAPGARYGPTKRYPAERFATAAAIIAGARGWPVVLIGEEADATAAAAVGGFLPQAVDLTGRTHMSELVGLLATSGAVLANDSGTMHLAAALGAPVVGVFGSTNPEWTRPLGTRARVVVHPVACAPCYARTCRTDFGCMLSIPASALVEACGEVTPRALPPGGRTAAGARP